MLQVVNSSDMLHTFLARLDGSRLETDLDTFKPTAPCWWHHNLNVH